MSQFIDKPRDTQAFVDVTKVRPVDAPVTKGVQTQLEQTYPVALDRTFEDVQRDIGGGYLSILRNDANQVANNRLYQAGRDVLNGALYSRNLSPEEQSAVLTQVSSFVQSGDFMAPDIAAMLAANPEASREGIRVSDRSAFTNREIQKRIDSTLIEDKSPSTFDQVLENVDILPEVGWWTDQMVSDSLVNPLSYIPGVEAGTELRVRLAQDAARLIHDPTLSNEDFEKQMADILDEVGKTTLITGNPYTYRDFMALVESQGQGTTAWQAEFWRAADLASFVVPAVPKVANAVRAIPTSFRPSSVSRLLTSVSGLEASNRATVAMAALNPNTAAFANATSPGLVRPFAEHVDSIVAPELRALRTMEMNNTVLEYISNYRWGQMVPEDVLDRVKPQLLQQVADNVANHVNRLIDTQIEFDAMGLPLGSNTLGKANGVPFTNLTSAQKLADQVGGEVRPLINGGSTQYVVRTEHNLSTQGLADPTDLTAVRASMLSRYLSSTYRTTPILDAYLKRGEAAFSKVTDTVAKTFEATLKKAAPVERTRVDAILQLYRDDPLYNFRKEALTEHEFELAYHRVYGSSPPKTTTDLFKGLRDMSNTEYFIQATELLSRAIDNGEIALKVDGVFTRAKVVTPAPDEMVFDFATRKAMRAEDLPKGRVVYQTIEPYQVPGDKFVKYVTGTDLKTRRLYQTDVLGYNVGGHRIYKRVSKFFIKQEGGEIQLVGGGTMAKGPRAFMGVRTKELADKAAEQFNEIVRAIKNGSANIDAVIRANNSWHPDIENFSDFEAFAKSHGLAIDKEVRAIGDGEPFSNDFVGSSTAGEYFANKLASNARGTKPLVGYGGQDLITYSPLAATQRTFVRSIAKRADQRYTFNALNGWFKIAEEKGAISNIEELRGLPPAVALQRAVVRAGNPKLLAERETILNRIRSVGPEETFIRRMFEGLAAYAFNKNWDRLGKNLDWMSEKDPIKFMRGVAFHFKMGMFAFDQFLVQSSQLLRIAGVGTVTDPIRTMRSMTAVLPLRISMIKGISPQSLEHIASAQAAITGISKQDFLLMREWANYFGRTTVSRTFIEENNSYYNLIGGVADKALDMGTFFFKEGEIFARLGALALNVVERRSVNATEDLFSDAVVDQMISRQDRLTQSMTAASGARWQRGTASLPLQFITYNVRLMEALFTDKILSSKERLGLGIAGLMAYGVSDVPGLGYLLDREEYKGNISYQSEDMQIIRWGLLDYALSNITGVETALSSRLSVGEGLTEFLLRIGQDPTWETLAGPGGNVTLSVATDFMSMMKNIFTGQFDYVKYDWNRFARNASSYERGYTIFMGLRYQEYYNRRTEAVDLDNMTTPEVFIKGLGIPLKEQEYMWSSSANLRMDNAILDTLIKDITRLDNIAADKVRNGEDATYFYEEIGARLAILRPNEREQVMYRLNNVLTLPETIIRKLASDGRIEAATQLSRYTNGNS